MPDQTLIDPTADTGFDPDDLESIDGAELLEQVTQFIGRYLQCSEHQRTVLALWVLHTHCLPAAQVTPYLAIQSSVKQSGKTLCLQLLNLLCDSPALTAGFTANTLTRRIDGPISTILLDECPATVGTRARSKGPTLRAILASGYHCGPGYTDATHERNAFCPKAFAGMGQLPEALADRSISIILEPLEMSSGAQSPGSPARASRDGVEVPLAAGAPAAKPAKPKVHRFDLSRAIKEAKPLQERLSFWADENLPELEEKPVYSAEDFPPNLSPRRQDMTEPLLQLADFIGGDWSARIREALDGIFAAETKFELRHSLQLLADIRDCFAHHNYPERLSTAALLDWLHTLPTRSWDMSVDGPITARSVARLLLAFHIYPRVQRIGSGDPARGYQLKDFVEPWRTHLGFDLPVALSGVDAAPIASDSVISHLCPLPSLRSDLVSSGDPASPASSGSVPCSLAPIPYGAVTHRVELKTASKDAGCNAVTGSRVVSVPPGQTSGATAKPDCEGQEPQEGFLDGCCIPPQNILENGVHNEIAPA